jgi:6-phosphogluconolactonase (cycloisomerase 2 family)
MTNRVRAGLILTVALAMTGLAGCGHYICSEGATFGSSSCTSSGSGGGGGLNGTGTVYAYLLSEVGASDGMAADTLDLSANTFQEASSFVAPPLPSTLAADGGTVVVNLTSQKYLYIPFNNGTVYGYAIDGTSGALTSVTGSPYTVLGGTSITATPAGTFLFVGDSASGDISVFSISATNGSLTAVGSPFASGIAAAQITTDGLGKYLYATSGTGGAQVAALAIGSTGALSLVTGSPFSFPMSKVLGENSGKYLLGITGFDDHIHVFGINSLTGVIGEVTGSPFATTSLPTNLVVHPSGSFVYGLDGLSTAMEGYRIDASTGALTGITGSPFTGVNLNAGEFDQSGKYLFGVAQGPVAIDFGPYGVDTSTGAISLLTYTLGGFPGGGFAVSDLNDAP